MRGLDWIGLFHVSTLQRIGVDGRGLERSGVDGSGMASFMCPHWSGLDGSGMESSGWERNGLFYASTVQWSGLEGIGLEWMRLAFFKLWEVSDE